MQSDEESKNRWNQWHEAYERPESSLTQRLTVVRRRIGEALDRCPPGPIRVVSMCAGDGRDLLGVSESHGRASDVRAWLIELDPQLARRAREAAPPGIEVVCGDAGHSNAYVGAVPADLLLCCGVFGNISEEDIITTIKSWPMLCDSGATVIWTRGGHGPGPDRRDEVRSWVTSSGFEEIAFDGAPATYGVGVARMVRDSEPFRPGARLFEFCTTSETQNA